MTTATEYITNFLVPSSTLQEPLPLLLLSHVLTSLLCLGWSVRAALGSVRAHCPTGPLHQFWGYLWGHPSIPQGSDGKRNQVPSAILIQKFCTDRSDACYLVTKAYLEARSQLSSGAFAIEMGALQDHATQLQCRTPKKCNLKGRALEKGVRGATWSHCKEL